MRFIFFKIGNEKTNALIAENIWKYDKVDGKPSPFM